MKRLSILLALTLLPVASYATDITYADKTTGSQFTSTDANEIKSAVNSKVDKTQVLTNVPSGAVFTDDQTASEISFTPNGSIEATDVQSAIQEVRDEAGSGSIVYPGAGIPNSTGTAWGTSYSLTTLAAALDDEGWVFTGSVDMTGASSVSLGPIKFADSDGSPSTVGEFRYDNNVTGFAGGSLEYNNGTVVKNVVDYDKDSPPTTTGQVPTYDATNQKMVWNIPSGGTSPTIQADDPDSSSPVGFYGATTSGHFFYKSSLGLFDFASGTYTLDPPPTYTLNLSITGGGTVTIDSTGYTSSGSPHAITGQSGTVNMTAAYGTGEDTITWSGDTVSGTYPDYTIDMGSADKTITAAFSEAAFCSTQSVITEQTSEGSWGNNISDQDAEGQGVVFASDASIYSIIVKTHTKYGTSPAKIRFGTSADLSSSYLAESAQVDIDTDATEYEFVFPTPISVTSGTQYYWVISNLQATYYFSLERSDTDSVPTQSRWYGSNQIFNASASNTTDDYFYRIKKCD